MFQPTSPLAYRFLRPEGQAIVLLGRDAAPDSPGWEPTACAALVGRSGIVRDVVRDLLANPQVRALVFVGEVEGRAEWTDFFEGTGPSLEGIDAEHVQLVRQFVGMYDDLFLTKDAMQPFWPVRIRYLE